MATCGIMRIEKRGRASVFGLQIEANRTEKDHMRGRDFDRSDIDWNLTGQNEHLIKTDSWNKEITRQIKAAGLEERKNSIVMLDGLYTASPEWFEQHTQEEARDYFKACLDFHIREYCGGDPSRVINAVIHMDEKTPHMQVASVPIIEDEKGFHLSAKVICGGRADFRKRQDRFFEQVSKERGLERGEVRDSAEKKAHTSKREWQIATQEQRLEQATQELSRARRGRDRAEQEQADIERQTEAARQELEKTLDEKARASIIKKPGLFSREETATFHANMLEDVRAIGAEARKDRQRAEEALKAAITRQAEAERKEGEIEPLHAKARKELEQAERYRQEQESYILGTAENLARERIDQIMDGQSDRRSKRLEDLCSQIQLKNGQSVLEYFEDREAERAERLRSAWDYER